MSEICCITLFSVSFGSLSIRPNNDFNSTLNYRARHTRLKHMHRYFTLIEKFKWQKTEWKAYYLAEWSDPRQNFNEWLQKRRRGFDILSLLCFFLHIKCSKRLLFMCEGVDSWNMHVDGDVISAKVMNMNGFLF